MSIEGTRRAQEPGISPSSPRQSPQVGKPAHGAGSSSPSSSPTPYTVRERHVHSSKIPPNPP
ncbi:hypothetical protein [Scytonema sp. HK-05]|uniref:hypothetical protein n=1 Tax=Scytonema sp. HK-05 TaxID=1137095 RepID=UPI000AAB1764|nr:hypothetical protein [Scytonema sp. HK-05]